MALSVLGKITQIDWQTITDELHAKGFSCLKNILTVEVHNVNLTSSDLTLRV